MPSNRGKQKQALKHKKKRELAQRRARVERAALIPGSQEMIQRAARAPFGPAFVSTGWDLVNEAAPELVGVVVTRVTAGGLLLPASALVDRTCLGVKNAFVIRPLSDAELLEYLDQFGAPFGGMEMTSPLVAQSIVFHAVDYARTLGFAPHPDFPEILFGPRPDKLLDTPLSRPSRPVYVAGPHDNVVLVINTLNRAVGPGNYEMTVAMPLPSGPPMDEGLDLDEDNGSDEDDDGPIEGGPAGA